MPPFYVELEGRGRVGRGEEGVDVVVRVQKENLSPNQGYCHGKALDPNTSTHKPRQLERIIGGTLTETTTTQAAALGCEQDFAET